MKIANQLFWIIFLSLFIGISCLLTAVYLFEKDNVQKLIVSHLLEISELKENRIRDFLDQLHLTTDYISRNPAITDQLISGVRSGGFAEETFYQYVEQINSMEKIYLVDTSGKIISSSDPDLVNNRISELDLFKEGMQSKNLLHKIYRNQEGELVFLTTDQVLSGNGRLVGLVVAEINTEGLLTIAQDPTGLGRSGETLIAVGDQDGIFVTPLKHSNRYSFSKVKLEDTSYAMGKALAGIEGVYSDIKDYSGQEVIAVTDFIEAGQLGLVTKIDKDEALKGLRKLQVTLLSVYAALIPLIVLLSKYIGNKFTRPVSELADVVRQMEKGDLSARSAYKSNNEIGQLAQSFNDLSSKLEIRISELDRFAYIVSHDLRAPLKSIDPLVKFIQEDEEKLSPQGRKMLSMISDKVHEMDDLVHNILESARNPDAAKRKVSTGRIIKKVIEHIKVPDLFRIQIDILPELVFNETELYQIFQNVISNAIKYNDKKEGLIKIYAYEHSDKVIVVVEDNGQGIPSDKLREITAYQNKNNDHHDSYGIGLYTVEKNLRKAGGCLEIESEEGKGTKVRLIFAK